MKLIVLLDNNTFIDKYFVGEPGLSFLILHNDIQILFDAGYTDCFMKNAAKMNLDLLDTDYIVLSHGHNDHTQGLNYLWTFFHNKHSNSEKKPTIIGHPYVFNEKIDHGQNIGSSLTENELRCQFNIKLEKKPFWFMKDIVFLGEIPRKNNFENSDPIGLVKIDERYEDDIVLDDSALVYKSPNGLVIITGCSHSGICNIVEYAKKVCSDTRIIDIIGGFHLLSPDKKVMKKTLNYLKKNKVSTLHPSHCVDLKSKFKMSKEFNVEEVGVSLELDYE